MPIFILTTFYLLYLALICQTLIIHDSIGYMAQGQELLTKSWLTMLREGSQREPLYLHFLSMAFHLAQHFKADPLFILKIQQIFLLAASQAISYLILRQLKARPWTIGLTIAYIGLSPVLVNSIFWVYSEILIIPFILLSVLFTAKAWADLDLPLPIQRHVTNGFLAGISLSACVFVKNIFELIGPCLLVLFLCKAIGFYKNRQIQNARRCAIVCCTALCVFFIPILGYKYLNFQLNGKFNFTSRASFALIGNTLRRSQPIDAESIQAALAYAANPHFCYAHLDQSRCDFWSYKKSDRLGSDEWVKYESSGIPQHKIDAEAMRQSLSLIKKNPLQHAGLALIETGKMLFWETTKAGQVIYPKWLDDIYRNNFVDGFLLVLMALLSACALVHLGIQANKNPTALMMFFLIVFYALGHSLFFVLHRYSIPIVPLWIISIAYMIDHAVTWRRKPR